MTTMREQDFARKVANADADLEQREAEKQDRRVRRIRALRDAGACALAVEQSFESFETALKGAAASIREATEWIENDKRLGMPPSIRVAMVFALREAYDCVDCGDGQLLAAWVGPIKLFAAPAKMANWSWSVLVDDVRVAGYYVEAYDLQGQRRAWYEAGKHDPFQLPPLCVGGTWTEARAYARLANMIERKLKADESIDKKGETS